MIFVCILDVLYHVFACHTLLRAPKYEVPTVFLKLNQCVLRNCSAWINKLIKWNSMHASNINSRNPISMSNILRTCDFEFELHPAVFRIRKMQSEQFLSDYTSSIFVPFRSTLILLNPSEEVDLYVVDAFYWISYQTRALVTIKLKMQKSISSRGLSKIHNS